MQWKIGDVKVTMVRELLTDVPPAGMFPDVDPQVIDANADWLRPMFLNDDGTLALSIHALVLESQDAVVVVDTCIGSRPVPGYAEMSELASSFLDDLAAAGYSSGDVDVVLCTHLHFDHVGWNTRLVDGRWVPTFPNARYLFGRIDYEYWDSGADGPAVTFSDAVRPVVDAGQAELVEMDHRVNDEIWLEPTPGHSPGHVSVRIASGGVDAVITGDVVHHPIQFQAPHWHMVADDDHDAAAATRAAFRDRYRDSGVRVFGTHFGGSSTGFLESYDAGCRFVAR